MKRFIWRVRFTWQLVSQLVVMPWRDSVFAWHSHLERQARRKAYLAEDQRVREAKATKEDA